MIPGPGLLTPETGVSNHPDSAPPPPPRIGGGSQTETLTGQVLSDAGVPLPGIRVELLPSGYDPSQPGGADIRTIDTDDSGRFAFDSLDTADFYNVIAGAPALRQWAYAESLQTRPDPRPIALSLASTFLITLHKDGAYSPTDSGIAYFPGTDILARCDGRTTAQVDSIPYGLEKADPAQPGRLGAPGPNPHPGGYGADFGPLLLGVHRSTGPGETVAGCSQLATESVLLIHPFPKEYR